MNTFDLTHALRDVRTNSVIAICLLIKRDCKMFTAMACLCVLLGGLSYAAGAESLIIAGATYYEPDVSGPGWAWTDAGHLELNGYAGGAIGAEGDLVLTLAGQNSVTESHAPDADIMSPRPFRHHLYCESAPPPTRPNIAVRHRH